MKLQMIVGFVVIGLIVSVGVLMLWNDPATTQPPSDAVNACTADALLCPDGSGVGRGGPSCTFDACPQASPLVGELEQIGGDFQLILDAEVGGRGYVVPLQVQVSNALGTLVGKRVQAFGRFEVGNTFVVETLQEQTTSPDVAQEEEDEEPFVTEVHYQEMVSHDGLSITFSELTEDNRCPSDVTCITAGRVVAQIDLSADGVTESFTFESDTTTLVEFNGYTVELLSVSPEPVSTESLVAEDYILEIQVR